MHQLSQASRSSSSVRNTKFTIDHMVCQRRTAKHWGDAGAKWLRTTIRTIPVPVPSNAVNESFARFRLTGTTKPMRRVVEGKIPDG